MKHDTYDLAAAAEAAEAAVATEVGVGAVASTPIYVAPVAAPGTGTFLPAVAATPVGALAACAAASFAIGFLIGTGINDAFDLSDKISDSLLEEGSFAKAIRWAQEARDRGQTRLNIAQRMLTEFESYR